MSNTSSPGDYYSLFSRPPSTSATDDRVQRPLQEIERMLLDSLEHTSTSATALGAGRAAAAELPPPNSHALIDTLFQVSRNHPLEEFSEDIQNLTSLIDNFEGSALQKQGFNPDDLERIRDAFDLLHREAANRLAESPLPSMTVAFMEAGIYRSEDLPKTYEISLAHDLVRRMLMADAVEPHAQALTLRPEQIAEIAANAVGADAMNRVLFPLRAHEDFRAERSITGRAYLATSFFSTQRYVNITNNIQTFEQIKPSSLVTAFYSSGDHFNRTAMELLPRDLLAVVEERGLSLARSPLVIASLLLRLGIIEPAEEALLRGEADEAAAIVDILMEGISLAAQESAGGAPLPALVMRHIVLEHTLLLLRRLLAAQGNGSSPETGHPE